MEMKKEDIKKEDMILNHGLLITVFTVIYFIFQQFIYPFVYIILVLTIVTLGDKISKILPFLEMSKIVYLYCGAMHIIFSIGLLFGKRIDILINKLKEYTKLKMKIEKNK